MKIREQLSTHFVTAGILAQAATETLKELTIDGDRNKITCGANAARPRLDEIRNKYAQVRAAAPK